jgi:pectate lyase
MISIVQLRKSFPTSIALFFVGAMLALFLSLGTSAQNQALFADDFEDGNANGWTKSGGSWAVVSDGSLVYRQSGTSSDAKARAGSTSLTNYSVQARVKPLGFNGSGRYSALIARAQSSTNYYYLALTNSNQLALRKLVGGSSTTLASKALTVTTGTWYTLRIDVVGAQLWGYVNGALELTATDSQFSSGNIGGATFFASAEFDDFAVTSLSGPPAPVPPAPPTGLTGAPGNMQALLSWAASSGATTYNVKRSTTSGGPYATIASVASTNYTNTGLTNGVTYYFVVSALNSAGESANSAQVSVTPADAPAPPDPPAEGPIGFAAVNALGQNGTTGGAGGPVVTARTAGELLDYISRPGPYIIIVEGMITLPGPMHDVTSDKTIIGRGANSGVTGGGFNIGLPVDDNVTSPPPNAVHNIIIRNLIFTGTPDDGVNVQMFSHHVWIDHCDLSNGFDGLIDIKRGADYITVSWNHTHNHVKNMLLGHSDSNGAQDIGHLRVTYHHNWFDDTPQRNPRVRFGEPVHIFNNYYFSNSDVGVACQANAGCMVEGNYFEDVEEPMTIHYSGPTGRMVERSNVFVGDSGAPVVGGSVVEPSDYYGYSLQNASDIKTIVTQGAGVGKIGF